MPVLTTSLQPSSSQPWKPQCALYAPHSSHSVTTSLFQSTISQSHLSTAPTPPPPTSPSPSHHKHADNNEEDHQHHSNSQIDAESKTNGNGHSSATGGVGGGALSPTASTPNIVSSASAQDHASSVGHRSLHLREPSVTTEDARVGVKEEEEVELDPTSGGDERGKKPLKNTKRAAQNRAAQRAFRERREAYVKELENRCQTIEALKSRESLLETRIQELESQLSQVLGGGGQVGDGEREGWEEERMDWEMKEWEWEREKGRLKGECEALKRECESWKRRCYKRSPRSTQSTQSQQIIGQGISQGQNQSGHMLEKAKKQPEKSQLTFATLPSITFPLVPPSSLSSSSYPSNPSTSTSASTISVSKPTSVTTSKTATWSPPSTSSSPPPSHIYDADARESKRIRTDNSTSFSPCSSICSMDPRDPRAMRSP